MSIDQQQLITWARQFIAVDSSPGNGTHEFAKFCFDFCQQVNLDCRIHEEVVGGQLECSVLVGEVRARPRVLLQSHIDTNDPGPHSTWERNLKNPFSATIHEGLIYGLGTADAKLDFLAKLIALMDAQKSGRSSGLLIGTFDGLGKMSGALKTIRRYNLKPEHSLVSAPTKGKPFWANPGQLIIRLLLPFDDEERRYREQHDLELSASSQSRVFHSSGNAIKEMLSYLTQLPSGLALIDVQGGTSPINHPKSASVEIDLVGGLKNPMVQKLIFWMDQLGKLERKMAAPQIGSVINLGTISSSADHIELTAAVNLTSRIDNDVYQQTLSDLKEVSDQSRSQLEIVDMKKPFLGRHDLNNSVDRALNGTGGPPILKSVAEFGWCTEASLFGRVSDRCTVFGPGHKETRGTDAFEHVRVDDLLDTTELYSRILTEN